MPIAQYVIKSLTTWSIGFFPCVEVYAVVAAGMAMRLDIVSSVVWGVLGSFTPIPVVLWGYSRLMKSPLVCAQLLHIQKRSGSKVKGAFERYGVWFLVFMTPIIGSWTVAVVAPMVGIEPRKILIYSFIGITLYGVASAVLIVSGMNLIYKL